MAKEAWVKDAEQYVRELLGNQLPQGMYFHSLTHTEGVVAATREIGSHSKLSKKELITVQIAAWFHDCGYCYAYAGHEDSSIAIAATWLKQQGHDEKLVNNVTGCILATQMPQNPKGIIEEVLCDADLFHLSSDDYQQRAGQLRKEWEARLKKAYTDREWAQSNIGMLAKHTYFTRYGKTVLQQNKLRNIDMLLANFPA